ncbi:hypothetical protein TREES_T100018012 [Tupaia chinensis]|uniref:Uncharacterized protein n=1 Tax=Tupaia chinensis TaxID=246437 RepID=L9JE46_TUPCH|nr:hypothetical protein TREES_T100018012 [Tupaia chinensis]
MALSPASAIGPRRSVRQRQPVAFALLSSSVRLAPSPDQATKSVQRRRQGQDLQQRPLARRDVSSEGIVFSALDPGMGQVRAWSEQLSQDGNLDTERSGKAELVTMMKVLRPPLSGTLTLYASAAQRFSLFSATPDRESSGRHL